MTQQAHVTEALPLQLPTCGQLKIEVGTSSRRSRRGKHAFGPGELRDGLGYRFAHLIAARADGRSDPCGHRLGRRVEACNRLGEDPTGKSAPAGVDRSDRPWRRDQDRHAVGRHYLEAEILRPSDQSVGFPGHPRRRIDHPARVDLTIVDRGGRSGSPGVLGIDPPSCRVRQEKDLGKGSLLVDHLGGCCGTLGRAMEYEPAIGLEVHVQLKTRTKIFCRCENRFGAEANSLVCGVCLGYPGTLPVVNREAVDLAVRLALALGCTVHSRSVFARKNYFYPDLPKGYQISQYDQPLAEHGRLPLSESVGEVLIERLHLEEDAGKLMHELPGGAPLPGESLADFNRCGVPLVEIVTTPDIENAAQAQDYLQTLHQVLLYTETSDGNMEEGSLRCDANVSVRPPGAELGTKAEVKNLNSFRNVGRAIEFEIDRQIHLLESGERVVQETRSFDAATGKTRSMRSKEEAHDYRYFPEPDLPPLILTPERLEAQRAALPELPWARRQRFVEALQLTPEDARLLASSRRLADYFEEVLAARENRPKMVANWVTTEILRLLKEERIEAPEARLAPERLAELIGLVADAELSNSAAKEVLGAIWGGDETARAAMDRLGLGQVRDETMLVRWVAEVLEENPGPVAQFHDGRSQVVGFLVGQVMQRSARRAKPDRVRELLLTALAAERQAPDARA